MAEAKSPVNLLFLRDDDLRQGIELLFFAYRDFTAKADEGASRVNYDPKGGHYSKGSTDPALLRPGFKVLHIAGIDNSSSCVLLTECLAIILRWSKTHPRHVPILLLFNASEEDLRFVIPPRRYGPRWSKVLDTAVHATDFEDENPVKPGDAINVINHSVQLLRRG